MLDEKKYKTKKYLHFDNRIGIKNAQSYVTDPEKISVHSFLPLIHFTKLQEKYYLNYNGLSEREDGRPIKEKEREIMYTGHMDNYIYQYYAELLNCKYNEWVRVNKIDECSVAYRNNKKGQSNINFAAEVIDEICQLKNCFILVGDFEKFFDTLDHKVLKNKLMNVLGINYLKKDWYNIFKSTTSYAYYEKGTLNKKLGSDKQIKARKELAYFKTAKDYRDFRRENTVKRNEKNYGIPQGTAISAVMANVYATSFDTDVRKIVDRYNGMYRRYSDDFVIIIPKKTLGKEVVLDEFKCIENKINNTVKDNHLYIQSEKTKLYEYHNSSITALGEGEKNQIDYLGFVFDGVNVKMREKSSYKFYRKAYKLIDKAKKVKEEKNLSKLPYRKSIYRLYTDMGVGRRPHGNFLTYAIRAQEIFDKNSVLTNNMMLEQIKNRKKKIEKRMGIKIHV